MSDIRIDISHKEGKERNPVRWVSTTYFAMGLPLILISQIFTLIYQDLGVKESENTYWTSMLLLPWSLKPLFSLFMEVYGTKRIYQITTEFISALMLGLIAFALPLPNFFAITIGLGAVLAISGSMHDIAGDGIYMQELSIEQQSALAGWQGAFYNLAKALANGVLVFLAGYLTRSYGITKAWMAVLLLCALLLGLIALWHFFTLPKEPKREQGEATLGEKLKEMGVLVTSFFQKKYIWLYLGFVLLYRLAEGLAIKVAPLFLKSSLTDGGLGMSNEDYGLIYGTFGTVAFIIGSILAGHFVSRLGLRRTLLALVLIFNVPFGIYYLLALTQPVASVVAIGSYQLPWVVTLGIMVEYLCYGFGFVGLTLFMMQQIAPGKYQMAHYAFANSLMNLSVLLPGLISGTLSEYFGYQTFFLIVLIVTLPVICFTPYITRHWAHEENN